jgi:Zn-dependent protease with chaperone function
MLKADFEALFERYRLCALRHPRLIHLRVTARAAIGLGGVLLSGAVALLGLVGLLSPVFAGDFSASPALWLLRIPLTILALVWIFAVVRILRARFAPMAGMVLAREEAPEMFALLERLQRRFRSPAIHEVRITGDLNAAITQRPCLYRGGRQRNTLILGLPLTLALAPRQFVAVLAHEFGHLHSQRVALGGWGCHLRSFWHQVLDNMENDRSPFRFLLSAVARHESPVYCAGSLVLSHLDEMEADESAARVVGAKLLGQALAELALKHRFLAQDYWRKVYAQADRSERPAILPYRNMRAALKAGFDRRAAVSWFDEIARSEDSQLGTHPSLSVRVKALGVDSLREGRGGERAGDRFLGPALDRLAGLLDRDWWDAERSSWRRRHWEVSRALDRIARLEAEGLTLGVSDRLELAMLVERYAGDRDPLKVYREMMPEAPGRPDALLAMGRLLVSRNDPSGVAYLRQSLGEDDAVGLQAAALLIEHYESCGMGEVAEPYRKRLAELLQQAVQVQQELDAPVAAVRNEPPGLEIHEMRALVRELRQHPFVRSGFVVRRICKEAPSWRACLVLVCVAPGDLAAAEEVALSLAESISLCGVWRFLACVEGGEEEAVVRGIDGAKFFSRRRSRPAPGRLSA